MLQVIVLDVCITFIIINAFRFISTIHANRDLD